MDFTYSFAIGFSLSQVVLTLALLSHAGFKTIQQRLFGLLMLSVLGFLFVAEISSPLFSHIASVFRTAIPGVFWLFNASLFDDHFKLKPWKTSLVLVTAIFPLFANLLNANDSSVLGVVLLQVPQLLEFVLLSLALFAIARHWQIDLVQTRRHLRVWFSGFNGLYLFTFIFFQQVLFPNESWLREFQYLSAGGALLITNLLLLVFNRDLLRPFVIKTPIKLEGVVDRDYETESLPVSAPPEFIEKLRVLMEEQRFYAHTGLTIGDLAKELKLQEYKLRQMINVQLGYRNFSDFLNKYRIDETAARLINPDEVKLPVLSIALDVGFRSLSSFNKAFKIAYEQTPTEYRKSFYRVDN